MPTSPQLDAVLAAAGRWRWLVLALPLLGAVTLASLGVDQDPGRVTTATVSVLAPEGEATGATVTQAVDGFRSVLGSEGVVEEASRSIDATRGDVEVRTERVGTSNLVEVTVTAPGGTSPEAARALVEELVRGTVDQVYAAPYAVLDERSTRAEEAYQQALAARERLVRETGVRQPVETYRATASEVTQLRVALAVGTATAGDGGRGLRPALDRARERLVRLGQVLVRFEEVDDAVSGARAELAVVRAERDALEVRRAAAAPAESVVGVTDRHLSRRAALTRDAVTGAVAGLGLAALVVLGAALLRGGPRPAAAARRTSVA